jgi:hypothetical protein
MLFWGNRYIYIHTVPEKMNVFHSVVRVNVRRKHYIRAKVVEQIFYDVIAFVFRRQCYDYNYPLFSPILCENNGVFLQNDPLFDRKRQFFGDFFKS